MPRALALRFLLLLICALPAAAWPAERLVVGSKRFTESYILGEIVARTAQEAGARPAHRAGLGNTAVVLQALQTGDIDVYPEYLGTIEQEILRLPPGSPRERLQAELAKMGLALGVPLGFANGYGLATTAARARELSLGSVSDLKSHPGLQVAVSQEFLGRTDGWPGLAARYGLPQRPAGIDHGLAYEALAAGRIAVTDIYTTDAQIERLGLVVLLDDAGYFPRYDAVLLYRRDLPQRVPKAWKRIAALEGRIDQGRMIRMNAEAELQGRSFAAIADGFLHGLASAQPVRAGLRERLFGPDFARLTREHVALVAAALLIAVLAGLPLGALAATRRGLRQPVFAVVGVLQTIPALALLAALIPLFGRIGTIPAVATLAVYALLPIVRNTEAGLAQVPRGLQLAATALGLTATQRWRAIDLPLAAPVLLAGIKTAAVITVGTATIAAFIGAGGYGERIVQGLALNDSQMLLAGALPSAALALLTQGLFELMERWLLSRQTPAP